MPRRYPKYIREEAVKRYLAEKKAADVATEIGCATSTIYKWVYKHWMNGCISTGWKKGVKTMLLIEAEHSFARGKTYLNAAMIQDIHVEDIDIDANVIDPGEYTVKLARFDTKEQATAALERLIPYLGKSGDGIIKLKQWTGKENKNV